MQTATTTKDMEAQIKVGHKLVDIVDLPKG